MAERTEELRRDIESTRDHMTTTLDAIGDRVSPGRVVERRWNRVRSSTSRVGESIMGTPRRAGAQVSERASAAAGSAGDAAGGVGEAIGQAPDQLRAGIEGNPLAAGAVAFGLGVLLGSLAPAAEAEVDRAGQLVEPLKDQARSLAQDVVEPVKAQVGDAVDSTKGAVSDAVGEVKEQASAGAQEVSQHGTAAAGEVQEQAKDAAQQVRQQGS